MAFLKRRDVERRVGISTATLYRWIGEGRFPRPVKIGPSCVRWPEAEIEAWTSERIAERDAEAA